MQITWLGHSAFRLEIGEAVVLIDPFLTGNSVFTGSVEAAQERCTHIVITHGHDDHVGDAPEIAKATGAQVVANFETCMWLSEAFGIENINPGNTGGTADCGPFRLSFVRADHSSGTVRDGKSIYLGNPLGVVIAAEGQPTLYHMGDTAIFSDMELINELHKPEIGIVPIGDRFAMGARTAALACNRYFSFRTIIPCHYRTFPILDQSADAFLDEMGPGRDAVVVPEPMIPFEA